MRENAQVLFPFVAVVYLGTILLFLGYHSHLSKASKSSSRNWQQLYLYLSIALHLAALFLFARDGFNPRVQNELTFSAVFFILSNFVLALFFKSQLVTDPIASAKKYFVWIATCLAILYLLHASVDFRQGFSVFGVMYVLTQLFVLVSIWQNFKHHKTFLLKVAFWLVSIRISLTMVVLFIAFSASDAYPWSVSNLAFAIRVSREGFSFLLYLSCLAYLIEALSADQKEEQQFETIILPLLDEKDSLNNALLKANQAASAGALSAALAHELKQPLAALQINADRLALILEREQSITRDIDGISKNMSGEVNRAASIISTIRELFTQPIDPSRTDVKSVIEETLTILMRDQSVRDVRISMKVNDHALILMPASKLRMIVLNLLNNAITALNTTHITDGHIEISSTREKDHILLSVRDNGPGIDPAQLKTLFSLMKDSKTGMGFGLWLVNYVVERYEGRVWYETAPEGGAEFKISLPVIAERIID